MYQPEGDERLLECAMRLQHSPEFEPFITYLKHRREVARTRLEARASERDAGHAVELKEVLDFLESAGPRLAKLRGKPPR